AAVPAVAPYPVPQRHRIWLWAGIVCTFAVAVLGGIAFWLQLPLPPPHVVNRTQITHDGLAKTNVLSDGTTLYLSENSQNRRTISEVPIDGSKPSTLALPFAAVGNAMAPDRASILLSEQVDSSEALW